MANRRPPMLALRPYQLDAISSILAAINRGVFRPAVVLPTGAGKTVIFSHLAVRWLRVHTGKVLILVHRDELVRQTVAKLKVIAPHLTVGVVKAGEDETDASVIVASVQTLANPNRLDRIKCVSLMIVDEAHHAAAATYNMVMNRWGIPVVGFTATMTRGDGKPLGDVWAEIVYTRDILDMIAGGHLVDVSGVMVTVDGLSLADVVMRGKDYEPGSLAAALADSQAHKFITDAYRTHAANLPGIVFAPDVATTVDLAFAFNAAGIDAAAVWGDMGSPARQQILADYEAGRIQVLTSCMVLTEGFDSPRASVAVIARPTTNAGLYAQMVGRVLRTYPGKARALVLDVVGVSAEHSLATLADLSTRRIPVVESGESLLEAAARERKRRNPNLDGYVVGSKEVDLFHRSRITWLETHGGVWFLSVPGAFIFLWPDELPGTYKVGVRSAYERRGHWLAQGASLEYAMAWGEQTVAEYIRQLIERDGEEARYWNTKRSASWRKRPATQGQIDYAASKGLDIPLSGTTRGEASDAVSVHLASQIFDKRK